MSGTEAGRHPTPGASTVSNMNDEDKTPKELSDELMHSEELELRNERIKAIGELAGGVAHNFNNLLQIITGGCEVALQDLEAGNLQEVRNTIRELLEKRGIRSRDR